MKKMVDIFLVLAIGLLMAGCGTGGGHWVLVDTEFHEKEWQAELVATNQRDGFYRRDAQVSVGSVVWVDSYVGEDGSDRIPYAIPGNTTSIQGSWTEPSDTVHGPKFEVSMRIKIEVVDQDPEYPLPTGCTINAEVPIPDEEGDGILHSYLSADDGESSFFPSLENGFAPIDVTVYGDMEEGQTLGERRVLEIRVGPGHPLMSYIYEWQE